jgi:hypothetical protein
MLMPQHFSCEVIAMRSFSRWFVVFSLIVLGFVIASLIATTTVQGRPQASHIIYDDALVNGWENWPWPPVTLNWNNTSPVHGGSHSLAVTYTGGWGAVQLGHQPNLDLSAYDTLRFWIHGGSSGGQSISVRLDEGNERVITPQANTWRQIDIPLSQWDSPTSVGVVIFRNATNNAQPIFYLDDIQFVNVGLPTPTPVPPGVGPALSVDAQADRHPISPYIYGMNLTDVPDEDLAAELDLPVRRWGGNSTSRYNWQLNVHNTGSDWYFENIPDDNSGPLPDGSATNQFVDQDQRTSTKTILTMPLIGWTPKRRTDGHPFDCGFNSDKYGEQQDADWDWDPKCGNGVLANGDEITGNDPTDTSVAITTTFVTDWINYLKSRYGTAANGGVLFYNLDNEPMLWNSTHRDVHPDPTTYDEMRDVTYAYAAAIKQADPSAKTLGPVLWGWCAYFFSALDDCRSDGADYTSHGNIAFAAWYLKQLKTYEQDHGVRLLDYLDLHYYPQADGVALSDAGSAATQARRLRSTRSLWDPTYVDESWIDNGWEGGIVKLIPRMKQWVNDNYAGTKLAITEYNWGALDHINGAVAQADVLGIFGREGLDLATVWGPPEADKPGAYAFRMYRNYDGDHHAFGDVSVRALSADQSRVAIYAAQRSSDNALTIMVINKSLTQTLTSSIALSNTYPITRAAVYRYSAANLDAIQRQADQAIGPGGFSAAFPPQSITLFVAVAKVWMDRYVFLPVIRK